MPSVLLHLREDAQVMSKQFGPRSSCCTLHCSKHEKIYFRLFCERIVVWLSAVHDDSELLSVISSGLVIYS